METTDTRNLMERDLLVMNDRLKSLGIAGGYYPLLTCDSTNNVLKKLSQKIIARESLPDNPSTDTPVVDSQEFFFQGMTPDALPFVVTSEEQTAGRGRHANTWWTGLGALAFSMLLDAKQHGLKPQTAALLSLGIGFAAMQALRAIVREDVLAGSKIDSENRIDAIPNIEIRWPNDVYVNERKVIGILIEAPNMRHIVIGIGVNSNNSAKDAPGEIREKIVTLRDVFGKEIDQDRLIFLLCREIMEILKYFPEQLPQFIKVVEATLYQVGKIVNISREYEQITGLCLGLNPDGSLRVLTETGEKAVMSGVAV